MNNTAAAFVVNYRNCPLPRSQWLTDFRGGVLRIRLADDVNDDETVYRVVIANNRVVEQMTERAGVYSENLIGVTLTSLWEMTQDYGEPPYNFSRDIVNRHRDYGNGHVVVD